MTEKEKKDLIDEFKTVMEDYTPDWNTIINTNHSNGKYDDETVYLKRIEHFCDAIKMLRVRDKLTLEQMGERLSYTKQYVNKIEKHKIKKIPIDKLQLISYNFSISVAYLLNLTDDLDYNVCDEQYYFWEHPDSKYNEIKDEVIKKPLIYPMITHDNAIQKLINKLNEKLKNDYELALALDKILNAKSIKKTDQLLSLRICLRYYDAKTNFNSIKSCQSTLM